MMTDSGLKSCPFCGEDRAIADYETTYGFGLLESVGYGMLEEDFEDSSDGTVVEIFHYVFCLACGGRTDDFYTPEEAVEAWNKRPRPSVKVLEAALREVVDLIETQMYNNGFEVALNRWVTNVARAALGGQAADSRRQNGREQ